MFEPGQRVAVNLAGMVVKGVAFSQNVTSAAGTIVRRTSENPPRYEVKLVFKFRGVDLVEVEEGRVRRA